MEEKLEVKKIAFGIYLFIYFLNYKQFNFPLDKMKRR